MAIPSEIARPSTAIWNPLTEGGHAGSINHSVAGTPGCIVIDSNCTVDKISFPDPKHQQGALVLGIEGEAFAWFPAAGMGEPATSGSPIIIEVASSTPSPIGSNGTTGDFTPTSSGTIISVALISDETALNAAGGNHDDNMNALDTATWTLSGNTVTVTNTDGTNDLYASVVFGTLP